MKKNEFIWRHLLYETIEKRRTRFEQQQLARLFHLSSSTVNGALTPLRRLGAVDVGGRGFDIVDFEKILYHWANHRRLAADTIYQFCIGLPIHEIEGRLPAATKPTAYTAVCERFGEPPADYDKVYCYTSNPIEIEKRFTREMQKGLPNLFVLQADPFLSRYGDVPLAQLFVDLWNIPDWYAKDFTNLVKGKIDGLLS